MRLKPDPWLAERFGHPVYSIAGFPESVDERAWVREAVGGGDAFIYARVPADDIGRLHLLSAEGFHVVDVALQYERDPAPLLSTGEHEGFLVRHANTEDYERVLDIAKSAFQYSRFHLDPLIPRHLADEVKRAWMDSYRLGSRGEACLVATDNEEVIGFLGILEVHREKIVHVIDLIGVDPAAQGQGVGRCLVEKFVEESWGIAEELEVGTQVANIRSSRLYERCGFMVRGACYVLHAHFCKGEIVPC
jgi:ribosomal protein S18 acetylase RimI-like enzyme